MNNFLNILIIFILILVVHSIHDNEVNNDFNSDFIIEFSKLMENTYQIPNFIMCLSKEVFYETNENQGLDKEYKFNKPINFCSIYSDNLLDDCIHFSSNYTLYSEPCDLFSRIDSEYIIDDQKYIKLFLDESFEKQIEYKNITELYEYFFDFIESKYHLYNINDKNYS